jgi:UDP-N-acetylmuramoyl-tripeptide--D-alanyl-D-alanine ligase
MESLPLAWIADTMNACIQGIVTGDVTRIVLDSRQAGPGSLFFALQGERADGHAYVTQALERGAVGAVVSRPVPGAQGALIEVKDTLRALGDLAHHYRARFTLPLVGITGSVGKTSTKEMTAAVLQARYTTLANEKNYNNEIGVPLALFQLNETHEAAVIEMGMRGLGEIDRLAEIAQPTVGVITNIGYAHIERLGSRERIAAAKAELLARLPADGTAIVPRRGAFTELLRAWIPEGCRTLTFSETADDDADVVVEAASIDTRPGSLPLYRIRVGGETFQLQLNVPGQHHGVNAATALAVGLALDVPIAAACAALERWQGAEGRMTVRKTNGGLTILDDCYNAGIESMASALATLEAVAQGRPAVAILGDMRELGDFAAEAHRRVGEIAADSALRLLVTVGDLAATLGDAMDACRREEALPPVERRHYADTDAAAADVPARVRPGDTILVKGSRAMEMERIVAALTGEPVGDAHG